MKRILFVVIAVILWAGLECPSWAGKAEFPTGSVFEVTPYGNYVSVTSYTVFDVGTSTQTGIQRIFENNGTGDIAVKWDTTNIVTTGLILHPQGVYIEDRYFGHIYFQSVDTTNNMRYLLLTK